MNPKQLERFGLTIGESKVYLALLKFGKSTIGQIIKEAKVSNAKVYEILDRLNKKGLVGIVTENNKKSFEAKSPEILKENLNDQEQEIKEKKKELQEILPILNNTFKSNAIIQEAEILKGIKGIKQFDEETLKIPLGNNNIYIIGSSKTAGEQLETYFIDWQKRRIKKKINLKILYTEDAKDFAKKRIKLKLTKVKILPKEITAPVAINIAGDKVGTFVFGENPLCFSIKNKEIADNYKNYFSLLWKISKKIK